MDITTATFSKQFSGGIPRTVEYYVLVDGELSNLIVAGPQIFRSSATITS